MILNNAEMLINHIRDLIYVQKILREIRESSSLAEKNLSWLNIKIMKI